MSNDYSSFYGSFRSELIRLGRSPFLLLLTAVQAITFIFLVNFFGMAGSFAPTGLVDNDHAAYSDLFIQDLQEAHDSFDLMRMDQKEASAEMDKGHIVAIITIPEGFSEKISYGSAASANLSLNNIDTDMTDDIQRALPSAITHFGNSLNLPGISVRAQENDLIDHDTGFISYLVVSALALSAFIISGILGAISIAAEFESKMINLLRISPANPLVSLFGRVLADSTVSAAALCLVLALVIFGYGIRPYHPLKMMSGLILSVLIFSFVGAAIGALIRKPLPVASLIFGISMPLYLISGAYEPQRFDGELIWRIAHLSPMYYSVGILESSMLNLKVTPESVAMDFLILGIFAAIALFIGFFSLNNKMQR